MLLRLLCSDIALTVCLCLGQLSGTKDDAPKKASEAQSPSSKRNEVSAKSLHRKVLCGYQGWFRCPGDPSGKGWVHWSRDAKRIAPDTLTFEMWPDLSEFSDEEKYRTPGFH